MFIHYGLALSIGDEGEMRVEIRRQAQEDAPTWPSQAPWQPYLDPVLRGCGDLHNRDATEIAEKLTALAGETSGSRTLTPRSISCSWHLSPASTLHLSVVFPLGESRGETVLGVIVSADVLSDPAWETKEIEAALRAVPALDAIRHLCEPN
jgi:hypothetical protein